MDKTFFYTEGIEKASEDIAHFIVMLRKERKHVKDNALMQAIRTLDEAMSKLQDAVWEIEDIDWPTEENA